MKKPFSRTHKTLAVMLRGLWVTACLILCIAVILLMAKSYYRLPGNLATHSALLPPAKAGELARVVGHKIAQHPQLSGIVPLASGEDAFATRMLLTDAATVSIDVQYYIWRRDLTGYWLLERLLQAANRGVRVRLLLDDHGTTGLDAELAQLQAHPNVQVRLWNPFTLRQGKILSFGFDFSRLNRRMHNKSFTVDGHASVVGGRNIGDEYFNTGANPLFIDLDVLTMGEVVADIAQDFDRYWNSPSAYPLLQLVQQNGNNNAIAEQLKRLNSSQQAAQYRQILQRSELMSRLASGELEITWTDATLISDDPAKGQGPVDDQQQLSGRIAQAVGEIQQQFDGVSAYFVPGAAGVKTFTDLQARGVKVRMLTNSLEATDVLPVHAGYAKRRNSLLEGDVQLFELRRQAAPGSAKSKLTPFGSSGASLHAKTFAVDGQRIFVGSFNFDPRSATLNTEMGILIDSEAMAQGLHDAFDSGLRDIAWQVELHQGALQWHQPGAAALRAEPGTSVWRHIAICIISWLPVEWLL